MRKKVYRGQSGQIVLITLLVLTIATTVALSLIARTTTDVTISSQVEESSRAFSAAEAGIEEALKLGVGSAGAQVLAPGLTYSVDVTSVGGAAGVYEFPKKTTRNVTETLWLVDHNADGTLNETPTYTSPTIDLCWSAETTVPALVATILYKRGANYLVGKGAYDPNASRAATNKFAGVTAASGGCSVPTMYRRQIAFADFGINPVTDAILMLRLRPVYADTQLAVDAPVAVPLQGNKVESVGATATGITRKIVVYQQYRSPSTLFDAALYSQSQLAK